MAATARESPSTMTTVVPQAHGTHHTMIKTPTNNPIKAILPRAISTKTSAITSNILVAIRTPRLTACAPTDTKPEAATRGTLLRVPQRPDLPTLLTTLLRLRLTQATTGE